VTTFSLEEGMKRCAIVLFIFSLFFAFSCGSAQIEKEITTQNNITSTEDSTAAEPLVNCPEGTKYLSEVYKEAGVESHFCVKEDTKILHGPTKTFYLGTTNLYSVGSYSNNIKIGRWANFYKDGNVFTLANFNAKHEYHGWYIEFNTEGNFVIGNFENGFLRGSMLVEFDTTGKIIGNIKFDPKTHKRTSYTSREDLLKTTPKKALDEVEIAVAVIVVQELSELEKQK